MLAAIRARPWLVAALVVAALLYAPTLGRGLTNYDDPWLYAANHVVQQPSWASLRMIFGDLDATHRYVLGAEYLPVRDLSVMLDYALFGDWYPGFHAMSLAIYLGAIALWYAALRAFGIERNLAGLALLVWAIHPSHAESVAWLAERKGVLAMMFAGAAALGYARYRGGARVRWLVLAALSAGCAVWSKAPAAFAIAALVPLECVLPGRVTWRRSLTGLAVVGAIAAAAFVPVLLVARAATVVGSEALAPITRRELVFGVHGFYTRLALMLPRNAIAYPIATQGPTILDLLLGIATPLAALAVIAVPRRVPPELRAAAWLWLLGWLPASHAILPLQNVAVDRYLLIPSLGFALAVAYGLTRIPAGRLRTALIAIVLLAAALRTWDAQSGWRDDATLWARAVDSDPANAGAWSQYAEALDVGGDPRAALAAARDGIAAGARPVAHLRLREGLVLRELGDADGAHAAMLAAAEGGDPVAMSNVALLELAAGHTTPALAWSRRGAELDPLRAAAHRTHGKVALAAHANDEAYRAFVRAYDLEPGYLGNRYNLGLALIALGRRDEARVHLEACLADPSLADAARAALIN